MKAAILVWVFIVFVLGFVGDDDCKTALDLHNQPVILAGVGR